MLFSLLDPRLWGALLLAVAVSFGIGFWKGDSYGVNRTTQHYVAAQAKADNEARELEQERTRQANAAQSARAAAGRIDADRLRALGRAANGLLDAADAAVQASRESLTACTAHVATFRAVFDSCQAEYGRVAEEAAGHAADSLMYQQAWPK